MPGSSRSLLVTLAALTTVLVAAKPASACGLTPPIGPNGLPAVCYGDDHIRMRAGLTLGGTDTEIEFGDDIADLLLTATTATFDVYPLERLGLSLALGASWAGHLDYLGTRYDFKPGILGGVGASYRFFGGKVPFVLVSGTFSVSRAETEAPDGSMDTFTSRDWRVGLAVGHVFGGWAAPFVVGRYFGAGTEWDVAGDGSDRFRYHVGVGSAFGLSEHFDVLAEVAFLGERRASLGVGYMF